MKQNKRSPEPSQAASQHTQDRSPLVSVIIPVRNGATTIGETLASLLCQTFENFEVLVMDDGSTDATGDIVTHLAAADSRGRIRWESSQSEIPSKAHFRSQPRGVSATRNQGLAIAQGEFISFLDADDLWLPEKLADQVAALTQHSNAVMVYSWTELMDDHGQRLGQVINAPFDGWIREHLLVTDFISSGSNVLIRRSPLEKCQGFDATLSHSEDWDLWLRLAAVGPVALVPKVQILYRQRPTSASINVLAHETASRTIVERELQRDSLTLGNHRHIIWGNRYKYLAFKSLDRPCRAQWGFSSLTTLRFLLQVIRCDRGSIKQWKKWLLTLGKLLLCGVLPPRAAGFLLRRFSAVGRSHQFLLTLTRVPRLPLRPLIEAPTEVSPPS
ncbi:MAG: glycosyltransferase [Cyanobacteria bacterium P01_C01_bin.89]